MKSIRRKLVLVMMTLVVTLVWIAWPKNSADPQQVVEELMPAPKDAFLVGPLRPEIISQKNRVLDDATAKIAAQDLEKVKVLRHELPKEAFLDNETLALAQDVTNAAHRVSYFPARRALIDHLKAEKNAAKLEDIISEYDKGETGTNEMAVLAHFSIIALSELSRHEGLDRGAQVYQKLAKRISALGEDESAKKIRAARLTDIYDLTRHMITNQIDGTNANWPEVVAVLNQFKVRENFLNRHIKEELKKAVASVSNIESVSELNELYERLESWWS